MYGMAHAMALRLRKQLSFLKMAGLTSARQGGWVSFREDAA
jgi:hypothetical protein